MEEAAKKMEVRRLIESSPLYEMAWKYFDLSEEETPTTLSHYVMPLVDSIVFAVNQLEARQPKEK